jgi:hypothetical protein
MAKKFILFGTEYTLLDDALPPTLVDLVTEMRYGSGIVYLSFATTVHDHDSKPAATPVARLRMGLEQAEALYNGLGRMILHARSQQPKKAAN